MIYKFEFEAKEVELLGIALGELPFKAVAQLVNKIQNSIKEQEAEQAKDASKDA